MARRRGLVWCHVSKLPLATSAVGPFADLKTSGQSLPLSSSAEVGHRRSVRAEVVVWRPEHDGAVITARNFSWKSEQFYTDAEWLSAKTDRYRARRQPPARPRPPRFGALFVRSMICFDAAGSGAEHDDEACRRPIARRHDICPGTAGNQQQTLANVVRTITMYDTECGRVAPEIVGIVRKLAGVVDGELLAAQLTIDHQIATAGRAEWCRLVSRGVTEATAILNEPPRKGYFRNEGTLCAFPTERPILREKRHDCKSHPLA